MSLRINFGLTNMQRLAIACGNEPYADAKLCPKCDGYGKLKTRICGKCKGNGFVWSSLTVNP